MKKAIFAVLLGCASLFAIEDTYENRNKEAARCLETMHTKEMLANAIEQGVSARAKNETEKKQAKELLKKYVGDEIISEMKEVMVKHYTADELAAMSDFYGTPVGQSIIKKQNLASADMMKKMQAVVMKMLFKLLNDKSLKNKGDAQKEATPTSI